jgi:hypothetical protein
MFVIFVKTTLKKWRFSMFWKRKNNDAQSEKIPGPKDIPEILQKNLDTTRIDPDVIKFLKVLVKNNNKGEKSYDFRIFDPDDAEARAVKVVNYSSLDGMDVMIICDGSYDEVAKTAVVNIKINIPKQKLLTQPEILKMLETLHQVGDQVFFFSAAGGGVGGPLGRGAAIIKVNPTDGPKKRKKYGVYSTSVVDMKPVAAKEGLVFDIDNIKELSKWIADSQKPRFT